MAEMDLQLVAYDAAGERLGTLPQPLQLDLGLPLNDLPSLTVRYTLHAARGSLVSRALHQGTTLTVEANSGPATGGGWVELPGARFVVQQSRTDTVDEQRVYDLTCTSWAQELRYGVIERRSDAPDEDTRTFTVTNPGGIMAQLLGEVKDVGGLPHLDYNFGLTLDSAGRAWTNAERIVDVEYSMGDDLLRILQNLTEMGLCDWRTVGGELQLFRPDTELANDYSSGASLRDLRLGRDVTEAPEDARFEDVASRIVVRGQDGVQVVEENPSAPTPYGHRTIYHSAGGVADEGTLRKIGQLELAQRSGTRLELTRGLSIATARWAPGVHYQPGDYVWAPGAGGDLERLRVRQITLSRDESGLVSGNVVLNDRHVEKDLKRALKLAAVLRGAGQGGTDGEPGERPPEHRTPAAPSAIQLSTSAYLDYNGEPRGQVSKTWLPVTEDTQGDPISLESYQIHAQNVNRSGRHVLTEVGGDVTTHSSSPYEIGHTWRFWVRCRSTDGKWSGFSPPSQIEIQPDTVPPPQPSPPKLTSRLGTISVDYDGLTYQGTSMPVDLSHIEVHTSLSLGFTPSPSTLWDSMYGRGPKVTVIHGMDYHDIVAVKLVAVDTSGNESEPSDEVEATVEPLVDTDLFETTIDERFSDAQDAINDINNNVVPNLRTDLEGQIANIDIDGRITVSTVAPAPADAEGKQTGHLWYRYVGVELVNIWRLATGGWVQMPLSRTFLPAVDIGTGTFGDLDGGRLKAHTVSTNALAVGGSENLLPDPGLINPEWRALRQELSHDGVEFVVTGSDGNGRIQVVPGTGLRVARFAAHNDADAAGVMPVTPNGEYQLSITAWTSGAGGVAPGVEWYAWWYDGNGAATGTGGGGTLEPFDGVTYRLERTLVAPNTAASLSVAVGVAEAGHQVNLSGPRVAARVGGVLIQDGGVIAEHITASESMSAKLGQFLQVSTGMLEANAVTADKADIGSLRAQIITGRVIQAEHLSLGIGPKDLSGMGVNHVTDPSFEDSSYWNGSDGALATFGGSGASWSSDATVASTGSRSLRASTDGASQAWQFITAEMPAPTSRRVYVGATARRGGGSTAPTADTEYAFSIRCTRASGQTEYAISDWTQLPDGTNWQDRENVVLLPDGIMSYRVRLFFRRASGGTLGTGRAVYFDDVIVQDVSMSKGTSRVQLDPTGLRILEGGSARLTLTASGMSGRDPAGRQTLRYDNQTGNVTISGVFRTGFSIPQVMVSHLHGRPAVQFISPGSQANWPARIANGGVDPDALALYSARKSGDTHDTQLTLFPGPRGFRLGNSNTGRPFISGGHWSSSTRNFFAGIAGGGPYGQTWGAFGVDSNDDWYIGNHRRYILENTSDQLRIVNGGGLVFISGTRLHLATGGAMEFGVLPPSASGGSDLGISAGGTIVRRSGSTRRIKTDIQDLNNDPTLPLRLREVSFLGIAEHDSGNRGAGLIAEEAEQAGMPDEFLFRDEQGRVEGIDYGPGWVTLLPLLRQIVSRLDALEANQ